jgi:sortase A
MDIQKQLSSDELEQLLQRRRRQEAVEGLRTLSIPSSDDVTVEDGELSLSEPSPSAPPQKPGRWYWSRAHFTTTSHPDNGASPAEIWLQYQQPRLTPAKSRKRRRSRQQRPANTRLKKALGKVVDTLVALALFLFVATLGLWLYENYVKPMLNPADTPAVQAQGTWLWPVQGEGRISSPEEAMPQAPLPFIPYSTTISVEEPFVPVPTQAPGTAMPTRLIIPSIQVNTPVEEVTIENGVWQVAQYAAGYHRGSARPGTIGNTVISGHNGLSGAVFRRLHELKPEDEILLYAGRRLYRYVVQETKSVWPYQVEVMAQTATPILTLITCTAYDTQRLIVIAGLDREIPTEASP